MSDPGVEALHRIEGHEKVCVERYGNIWSAVSRIEAGQLANAQTQHDRFNIISNRMWAILIWVAGTSVVGLLGGFAALFFWMLTRGKA